MTNKFFKVNGDTFFLTKITHDPTTESLDVNLEAVETVKLEYQRSSTASKDQNIIHLKKVFTKTFHQQKQKAWKRII